jgi:hypothetical protein
MLRKISLSLAALALCACGEQSSDPAHASADATATVYVDVADYWKQPADQTAWRAMLDKIDLEFNNVCGDTFCGGDYSNLTSLGFTCSVSSIRGAVHECVWTFTGSSHLVNAGTGTVTASVASFQCRVAPSTSARALLNLLGPSGGDPSIRRVLPGTTQTLYDVLGDCFQHPIGASPITSGTGSTYGDAPDVPGTNQDQWFAAEDALQAGFDAVCGDTFCEGDYSNLQALRFACSVRNTTGTLRQCKWLFGGSYNTLDSATGAITVDAKGYKCIVPVKGNVNDLSAALTAAGDTSAIDRTLPGTTGSAYDALLGCL